MRNSLFGNLLALFVGGTSIAAAADDFARVVKNTGAGGQVGTAVILKAGSLPAGAGKSRHVILVDTSASQVGEHRRQSLSLLESLLKALPDGDQVRLFAADLHADPLDKDFNDVHGPAVAEAVSLLKRRVPLGATHLEEVLRTALKVAGEQAADITYIGDGMSTADLVEADELRSLIADLRQKKVTVHSFGVGPQRNLQLLGILALQTGGVVAFDSEIDSSDEAVIGDSKKSERLAGDVAREQGRALATAIKTAVFFPDDLQFGGDIKALLPASPLPMRPDRETIYLVNGELAGPVELKLLDSKSQEAVKWLLPTSTELPAATFLPVLARQVDESNGLSNPLAGMQLFRLSQKDFTLNVANMAQQGMQALKQGDLKLATKIYDLLLPLEPKSDLVKDLGKGIEILKAGAKNPSTLPGAVSPVPTKPEAGSPPKLPK